MLNLILLDSDGITPRESRKGRKKMREACPLSRMVLPGNFRSNRDIIAVKAGNGIVYVFKDALAEWLHKIGADRELLDRIRHTRPGEVFEGIEELVRQAIANIREMAVQTAKRTRRAVEEVIAEVRSLLERLIKTLNLNISLSPM